MKFLRNKPNFNLQTFNAFTYFCKTNKLKQKFNLNFKTQEKYRFKA